MADDQTSWKFGVVEIAIPTSGHGPGVVRGDNGDTLALDRKFIHRDGSGADMFVVGARVAYLTHPGDQVGFSILGNNILD